MTLKLHPHPKPRLLSPCHLHPDQSLTQLCAPCLRERLSLLNPSSSSSSSTSASVAATGSSSSSSSSAALPELRRCKTFAGDKCERLGIGLSHEPRRRSCEVRALSTLEDLFTVDDEGHGDGDVTASDSKCMFESMNLGLLRGTYPVPELREEVDEESGCEIRVSADVIVASDLNVDEEIEDSKTIKEFIDLEMKSSKPSKKDFKEIAGSFWIAASVFSRKLQKWKRKQKSDRPDGDCDRRKCNVEVSHGFGKLRGRRLRDTQSEVGDYGFGRRSCDTDPRVSVDLGSASIDGSRISVDGIGKRFFDTDPRCSLDLARASVDCSGMRIEEPNQRCLDPPRASWDGRMNGKALPRATTPAVSVIENAMATVYGFNNSTLAAKKPMLHDTKLLITERELMSSRMDSVKDESSVSFDTTTKDMTSSASSSSNGTSSKKSMKWGKFLNVWGLLSGQKQHKSAAAAADDDEKSDRRNRKCSTATSGGETEPKSLMRREAGGVLSIRPMKPRMACRASI